MNLKVWLNRALTFAVFAILTGLLLTLYPFFPFTVAIVLALVVGAVSLEFRSVALLIGIALSAIAATYQDVYIGLTFLVILILVVVLATEWVDQVLSVASWILYFVFPPFSAALGIIPVVIGGLHLSRQNAIKVGVISAIPIFLFQWTRSIVNSGFMLVPSPASSYPAKPIPDPWSVTAFLPPADAFATTRLNSYFAPFIASIGDFRVYAFLVVWIIAGYITAIVAPRLKGPLYAASTVIGMIPLLVISTVFTQPSVALLAVAVIAGAVVAFVYKPIMALVSGPSLGVFSSFADLIPGGIPDKYSLLLGSPACDERNLIMDQFLQSGAKKDLPLFVLTTDIDFARSTTKMFDGKLTALVANSRATAEKNLVPLPTGIQNLTTLNIELVKLVRSQPTANARLCLDVLSDIMLTHKLLTTRKWVTDLLPRLEEWGFTTMGVFNPSLHSNEEVQSLLGLFKGYVEVFEREISGKLRRLIAVRKMVDILYKENELVIDKGLLQNSLKR